MAYDNFENSKRGIVDSGGDVVEVSGHGTIFSASAVHRRINKDVEYFVCYEFSSVTAASTVTFSICSRTGCPHGEIQIVSNAEFSFDLDVGTTEPGGTQVYQHNLNRKCNLNRSVAEFYVKETNGDKDITLDCGKAGAAALGQATVQSKDSGSYWLLDSGCTYHLRITNEDDAASWFVIKYRYHEHSTSTVLCVGGLGEGANEYDYVPA